MMNDSNQSEKTRLGWALVWAVAIMGAALFFRGNPAYFWIESGLTVAAMTFVVLRPKPVPCSAR
jgi:hypothetical protein